MNDSSLFNYLLSLRNILWLASHGLDTLPLKHPPVNLSVCSCVYVHVCMYMYMSTCLRVCVGTPTIGAVKAGGRLWGWFIHKRLAFNYSVMGWRQSPGARARHRVAIGDHIWALCHIRSPSSVAARLHSREYDFALQSRHLREFSTQLMCQSQSNKPVFAERGWRYLIFLPGSSPDSKDLL